MQRFKLIFHIVYVVLTLVLMYFSVDILLNTEQYLSKIKLSSYIKFPRYVMGIFLFVSILMAIEFVMQQLRIRNIKGGIEDLEDEVKDLKAKLYDKSLEEPDMSFEDSDISDEDEEDED
ncbi:hypothetical protein SAMN05421640_0403 [Ekhidna lutea]|uniref:Lipopolysaccharide assembly protein A domain-containing protein n=1 Tax=Ekhidna lutea TaxID=447679 RepID=A0A239EYX8_EKHLU|nr:hypothetical protein [Ekhidna lutea]SNS49876.1 hypothetical protein SAMN05421640_0403 [Ekhidna lutea]